jgi:hypothetical protein
LAGKGLVFGDGVRKRKRMLLGKEHPSTLTSINNLALVLRNHVKYELTQEQYRELHRSTRSQNSLRLGSAKYNANEHCILEGETDDSNKRIEPFNSRVKERELDAPL